LHGAAICIGIGAWQHNGWACVIIGAAWQGHCGITAWAIAGTKG
jgi:hypothetical protein